jgi:hypothetical protein
MSREEAECDAAIPVIIARPWNEAASLGVGLDLQFIPWLPGQLCTKASG